MKASLSTMSALLMSVIVLTSLITSFIIIRDEAMSKIANSLSNVSKVIKNVSRDIDMVVSNESIKLVSNEPPINVYGVYALFPNGTFKDIIGEVSTYNSTLNLMSLSTVSSIVDSGGKIVVVCNGRFLVIDEDNLKDLISSIGNNSVGSKEVIPGSYLRPYVVAGLLRDEASFIANPIPGSTYSPYANYVPDLYAQVSKLSDEVVSKYFVIYKPRYDLLNISVSDLGNGSTIQVFIPILLSRYSNVVQRFAIYVGLNPTYCSPTITSYSVTATVTPITYVVLPTDFLRTYLVTNGGSVMYSDQLINSVARSLYTINYTTLSTSASLYYTNSGCVVSTSYKVFEIDLNSSIIFNYIPYTIDYVVALVGANIALTHTSIPTNINYLNLTLAILNITKELNVAINNSALLNKPLLITSPIPNLIPLITLPNGTVIKAHEVSNYVSNDPYLRVYWINLSSLGNYIVKYVVDQPTTSEVPLYTSLNTKIDVASLSHVVYNYTIRSSTYRYVEVLTNGTINVGIKYDFIHKFRGKEDTIWPDNYGVFVKYVGVPSGAKYKIIITPEYPCQTLSFGWFYVGTNLQNNLAYVRLDSSGSCTLGLKVSTNYDSVDESFSLSGTLSVTDKEYTDYTVQFTYEDTEQLTVVSNSSLLKIYYDSNSEPLLALINYEDIINSLINS